MGISFKTTALALIVALAGSSAVAQERGGRGRGERREQRQEQRQERREHRQPEQRNERPQRPSFPQREERREDRIDRRQDRVQDRQDRINRQQDRLERREDRAQTPIQRDRIQDRQDRVEQREDRVERRDDRLERREDRIEQRQRVGNQQHRDHVRRDRDNRRYDIERRRGDLKSHRQNWRQKYRHAGHRDRGHIRSKTRWQPYYNNWWVNVYRPVPIYSPIRWSVPMPDMNTLQYSNVENIATNLEYVTSDVFSIMASVVQSSPNQEYKQRLTRVLGQMADAAENFTDAVDEGSYYEDSLYDLFYLDEQVRLATTTLDGYSQEYRVTEQMNALRYYVQELLYIYRVNM